MLVASSIRCRSKPNSIRKLEPTYKAMFFKKSYRKRTLLACGFAFIGQSTAVLVINNYGPTLYAALGYGTLDQLKLQCGWDYYGHSCQSSRRSYHGPRWTPSSHVDWYIGCCACLIIEAAIIATFATPIPAIPNTSALKAGVAAFYVFLLFYGCGIDVAGVVFYSEIFPNHLRAKGVAMSIAVIALTDLVYLQVTATAFSHIGWKFFLVFIIISGLGGVLAFIYLPETKGVPLRKSQPSSETPTKSWSSQRISMWTILLTIWLSIHTLGLRLITRAAEASRVAKTMSFNVLRLRPVSLATPLRRRMATPFWRRTCEWMRNPFQTTAEHLLHYRWMKRSHSVTRSL